MGFLKPKVSAPQIAQPEILDIIDQIAGIEQVTVTGPDGKKQIIRRELPLTAEQQQEKELIDRLIGDNLKLIEELSAPDLATALPEFQPAIEAFRATIDKGIRESFRRTADLEEEVLARRGVADSTSATEIRGDREARTQEAFSQARRDEITFAEQLRGQAIGRATNLLGLAAGRQDAQAGQALASLGQLQSSQLGLLNANTAVNTANANLAFQADNLARSIQGSRINAISQAAGAGFGLAGGSGLLGSRIQGGFKVLAGGS